MGRRSDHSRQELRDMIITEGHRQMTANGYASFSARKVAKRIGYSIGTIYNIFGTLDDLVLAINGRTLDLWREYLEARLDNLEQGRLQQAVEAYFEFAVLHRNAWNAVYDFHLPEHEEPPEDYVEKVVAIKNVVVEEIAAALPAGRREEAVSLSYSLLATVHGHCFFTLNGTFKILGETNPLNAAIARVEDSIAALKNDCRPSES